MYFSRHDTKKFVIFAQGRTGSSLLVDLLGFHPDIECDGEILDVKWAGKRVFPTFYVKNKAKSSKAKVYGFKVKLYQLHCQDKKVRNHDDPDNELYQHVEPEKFLMNLHKSGWKIIYLMRSNILRQCTSNRIAKAMKAYHQRNKNKKVIPGIKIDPVKLLKDIIGREEYLCEEKEILKRIPHLKLIYEDDLLRNNQEAVDKVFKFLGVEPCLVKSDLVRTSKDELQDYILNYREIKDYMSKTKYIKFF